ncbi:TetR/AcrR family transcriptional regulator [Paracoccus pacificus]|uniref:TetR/AcrR family transcriptional regulator n=1 Tax=Paracoccus pacificus TaxID=1463598 RepID=A0ABW4RAD3_9RHOB
MAEESGRQSYHHGRLRQALVDATARLIEEMGPRAFTLAEAARQVGVSPAAPYRHFRGRDDLVDEVARQGYLEFADRLEKAFDGGRPSPLSAFLRMGRAYLDFARERPGFYIAMFESGISVAGNPELSLAADRAESMLLKAAEQLFLRVPPDRRPPARMVANHIWAMSHGVVELFGRGKPGGRAPFSAEEMLESAAIIYLRGLGIVPE